MRTAGHRGFTLLEVMFALALLGLALTVLIKSAASSIFNAEEAHMMGVATDLARARMYEEEERLMKDGFTDTDQSESDFTPCDPELWQNVKCKVKVEQIELPSIDVLQQLVAGKAQKLGGSGSGSGSGSGTGSGSGSGSGSGWSADQISAFQNSTLGGMLSMTGVLGGNGSSGVLGAAGGGFIQMFYDQITQILKVSIRKVTLTVKWQVLGRDRDMKVVAFFTDPSAMDQVLQGFGANPTSGTPTGTGTGTGSGSNNNTGKIQTPGGTPTKP